jgi:HK97 family phage major capsid protein
MKGSTIAQWPILEVSLTTTPCEPRTVGVKMNESEEHSMNEEKETYEAHEAHDSGTDSVSEETTTSSGGVSRSWMDNRISQMEQKFTTLMDVITSQSASSSKMRPFVPGDANTGGKYDTIKYAWDRFLRTGERGALKAAMQEGTESEGGYLVPEGYSQEIIAALKDMSILRRAGARVISVTGTDSFNVPTLSHSTAAVKTSEEGAYSEVEPTVGEVTFVPMKLTKLVKVSEELLMDSRIDLMRQVLMPDFEQAFASAENTYFVSGSGSGSSEPQGITVGASDSGVTTSSASTISADNIIDTYHALGYLYRQNAVWLMNDTTIKAIRKLKETTTGNYLWQPGLTAGQPDTIMGRPVYTLNTMPELGTEDNKVIIFGDLSYYWIVDFGSESVRRLDELYSGNGQVGFRAYRRIGGNVMLDDAIVYAAAGS